LVSRESEHLQSFKYNGTERQGVVTTSNDFIDYRSHVVAAAGLALSCTIPSDKFKKYPTQGWRNRTLISHERVDSRILVLSGCESIFTEITEYICFSLISTEVEFKYKIDKILYHWTFILDWFRF